MSHEYAMSRVRDALEKSDGNHLKAQRLVMSWLENDHSLLLGLSAPHLHGIVSYAMIQAAQHPVPSRPLPKRVEMDEAPSTPGKASQKHIDAINTIVSKGKKEKL